MNVNYKSIRIILSGLLPLNLMQKNYYLYIFTEVVYKTNKI